MLARQGILGMVQSGPPGPDLFVALAGERCSSLHHPGAAAFLIPEPRLLSPAVVTRARFVYQEMEK